MTTWNYLPRIGLARPLPGGPYLPRVFVDPTEAGTGGGGTISWSDLTGVPDEFPPEAHTHAWGELSGVPDTFPPTEHEHAAADITGLPAEPLRDPGGALIFALDGALLFAPGSVIVPPGHRVFASVADMLSEDSSLWGTATTLGWSSLDGTLLSWEFVPGPQVLMDLGDSVLATDDGRGFAIRTGGSRA